MTVIAAQERDRTKIPERYKWDLTRIYPTDDAWREAKEKLAASLPRMREFKGTLASSPAKLADALELAADLQKTLARTFVYASMMSDQDTRVSKYQGMQQEMVQLGADLGAEMSFMEPEILKMDAGALDKFDGAGASTEGVRGLPGRHQRRRPHTGSDAEEKLLAGASVLANGPSTIYGILSDADFPYPTVTLSDGKSVQARQRGVQRLPRRPEP